MLSNNIRTSVVCDSVRCVEADYAAEVCDNNNRHETHYTVDEDNDYDIRPINEDLDAESLANREESMKIAKKNGSIFSIQVRNCLKNGGDQSYVDKLRHPGLQTLSQKIVSKRVLAECGSSELYCDKDKFEMVCSICAELKITNPKTACVKPFIYYVSVMTGDNLMKDYRPMGTDGNLMDFCLIMMRRCENLAYCLPDGGFVPKQFITNEEVLLWCK